MSDLPPMICGACRFECQAIEEMNNHMANEHANSTDLNKTPDYYKEQDNASFQTKYTEDGKQWWSIDGVNWYLVPKPTYHTPDLNKTLDSQIDDLFLPYLKGHKVLTVTFSGELGDDTKVFQMPYSMFKKATKHLIQTVGEGLIPEKKNIVVLTEPPQGIDRLWLEGRDYGATAGYNQAISDVRKAWGLKDV